MPEGVWDETSRYGDLRGYKHEAGDGLFRRTLYTIWKRSAGPPSVALFDGPNRDVCTVKRGRTNTPTQALALLNEITFVEAARVFATRILQEGGASPDSRFTWAMQQSLARTPTATELNILVAGLARQVARHNVVINNILPGPFLTDRLRSGAMATAKQRNVPVDEIIAERAAGSPTGRVGIPAEFGDACAFLCSANIGFIVGHNLLLDGGNFNSSIA